jgi:hypothetical protein
MNVLNLRPVGWDGMTPRQWGALRDLIRQVGKMADYLDDPDLSFRAELFLIRTRGFDV